MKKIIKIFLLLAAIGTLSACGSRENGGNEGMNQKFVMHAEITGIGEKIEVNVYEAEYAEGPYWINADENTKVMHKDGRKISLSELSVGDKIKITYNGQVAMSLPPQVYAREIEVVK